MISAHLRIPNFREAFGTLAHVMLQCLEKIHFPRYRPTLTLSKTSGPFHPGDLHGNQLTDTIPLQLGIKTGLLHKLAVVSI